MSKISLSGNASGTGTFTIESPNTNTNYTLTLPQANSTLATSADVSQAVPSGTVIWYAANTAPTGYLKANGALVSRSTYASLFAAIGTTFGAGDGSTTFGLPDLRGEFIRGWDDGRGVDSGRAFGSSQGQAIQAHVHQQTGSTVGPAAGGSALASGNGFAGVQNTQSTGGAETRPRNVALLACIKF
jgi:microcystin-dependent protein